MNRFLLLLILFGLGKTLSAQYVYTIKADSVKITNSCDTAELIVENHTQNVPGFLFNKGGGRTEFRKGLLKLNDSLYRIGVDTLKIPRPTGITASEGLRMVGNSVQLGTTSGQPGAHLTGNRIIPMNGNDLRFDGGTVTLSKQVTGSNSSSMLHISSYWNTTGSPTALRVSVSNAASYYGHLLALHLSSTSNHSSGYYARVNESSILYDYYDHSRSGPYLGIRSNNINPGGIDAQYEPGGVINLSGYYGPSAGRGMAAGFYDRSTYEPTGGTLSYCSNRIQPIIPATVSSMGTVRGVYYAATFQGTASLANNIAFENYNGNVLLNNQAGDAGGRTAIHINGNNPAAWLHLGAGINTAKGAPLKFTSGTVLDIPEEGAVEYDGADLYLTTNSVRYKLSKTLTGQLTTNFGGSSLAAWNSITTSLTIDGAETGDVVMVSANSGTVNPPSISISAYVTSSNTVTIRAYNGSNSAVTIASDTYKVRVIK